MAYDFSKRAGDSSQSAGEDEKDHKPGIPLGAFKIISKVSSPTWFVWVSKIFKMGGTCDEL